MAWKWSSAPKDGASEEWTGFIDQGVSLEGTLTVTGTFRIDGKVKGNIISEQTVILGDGAKVEGQIEGNRVVISGRFDGVIFAKGRVEIEPKGVVTGEVHSPCMVIDPGGIIDRLFSRTSHSKHVVLFAWQFVRVKSLARANQKS